MRFPIFWIGLALLAYISVQACNPSWVYERNVRFWWLARVRDVGWLPTSVDAPFARSNAWRQLVIYGASWLAVCSLWVGITRRRSMRILLGVVAANALAIGVLVTYQHVTGNSRTPWPLTAWTEKSLTGSFIYENHTGAYLALLAFVATALGCWFADHGKRMLMKSTPAGVLALAALFLAVCVPLTSSRGASLSLGVGILVFVGWFLLRRMLCPMPSATNPKVSAIVALVFAGVVLNTFRHLDFSEVYTRFGQMAIHGSQEASVRGRMLAHAAAADMLEEHWVRGVGAGGFRNLFPEYAKNYPEIYDRGNLFWEHAHCDWLEIPIELGLVGDLLILGAAGWWTAWFIRQRFWWNGLAVPLLLGCLQTAVHAAFDFPFQCPAILMTWCVLVTLAGRWVELGSGEGV